MPGLAQALLEQRFQGTLNDYVTAIAWSPNSSTLAIASAAGEILLANAETQTENLLQEANGQSIDCLAFSSDGQYFAAGGQSGQLLIWSMYPANPSTSHSPTVLPHPRTWLDHLAWNPTCNELAFSLGRYAQIWDAETAEIVTTLQFENSSVLDLAWHPQGKHLAVSGHQGVKIWCRADWEKDPVVREIAAASIAIALSPDGQYLASGNLDFTLLVWPFDSDYPWQMQGFPGKVRQLAWSDITIGQAPLLACASGPMVFSWHKKSDASDGWDAQVLNLHDERVNAIAFQPGTTLLASAAEDGWLYLWSQARQIAQILEGAPQGFSTLAWSPNGEWLAAGGQQGEWLMWQQGKR